MSFQRVDMWRVICDRCGVSANEGDYYAWADKDGAEIEATDGGEWLVRDGSHWCTDCLIWDEDEDEQIPNPAPIASPAGTP